MRVNTKIVLLASNEQWRSMFAKATPGPVRKQLYAAYLKSNAWRRKRDEVLQRLICQDCRVSAANEVHHTTYERTGDELPSDLLALCSDCHRRRHDGRGRIIWLEGLEAQHAHA